MKYWKKATIITIVLLLITMFVLSPSTYASGAIPTPADKPDYVEPLEDSGAITFGGVVGAGLDFILGINFFFLKAFFIVPGILANMILNGIANIGEDFTGSVTIDAILFNKIAMTRIDFFSFIGTNGSMGTISQNIANFYYAIRNLSIALSLAVLVYIGVQMAINNTAEAQAKYKQMFINWVVGFAIIFVLHYFIVLSISANNMLVDAIANGVEEQQGNIMGKLLIQALSFSFTTSIASGIMYVILIFFTGAFLIMYIKRMITVSFLIIIAPLISVTYSIDKIDNNRSEILDTWLREYLYNLLIQPFHCIIYASMVGTSITLMNNSNPFDFGSIVFAVIMTASIFFAEKIVKEIFGFKRSSTLAQKIAAGAIFMNVVSNVKNVAAIKNAVDETKLNRKLRTVPNLMPDGSEATPENILIAKQNADARKKLAGEQGQPGQSQNQNQNQNSGNKPSAPYNANRKERRHARNYKGPVKGLIRGYTRALGATTGYNYGKRKAKEYKARKVKREVANMSNRDLFEAFSENYRESLGLTDEDMVKKLRELYNADISKLKPEDVGYKAFIENQKREFAKKGKNPLKEMEDILMYGSQNA